MELNFCKQLIKRLKYVIVSKVQPDVVLVDLHSKEVSGRNMLDTFSCVFLNEIAKIQEIYTILEVTELI